MSFSLKRLAVIPESNSWTNDSFFCWSSLRSVRILNSFFAILRQSFVEFALLTFKASLTRTRLIDDASALPNHACARDCAMPNGNPRVPLAPYAAMSRRSRWGTASKRAKKPRATCRQLHGSRKMFSPDTVGGGLSSPSLSMRTSSMTFKRRCVRW